MIRNDNNPNYRLYRIVDTKQTYPSVTSVTSLATKNSIQEWRERVGEEEADRISARAAKRGTEIHLLCEKFLSNESVEADISNQEMWNDLRPILENNINNIMGLECALYSDKLNVAGTIDCLAEFNGVLSIIDFKTSKRPKELEYIEHYFQQMAAYSEMVKEHFDLDINNLVVIMGVDNHEPLIFEERKSGYLEGFNRLRKKFKEEYRF